MKGEFDRAEEMKEQKLYVCEFCGTQYGDKSKAKICEDNHKKCKKIIDTKYLAYKSDNTGRPHKVCVEFDDGSTQWYSRM